MTNADVPSNPPWTRHLPWIDSLAGLTVGLTILLLRDFLATFYGLPAETIVFIGAANAAYSIGGVTLGLLRTQAALIALVVANLAWTAICAVLLIRFAAVASPFGIGHLVAEGVFVGVLGLFEWRHRRAILSGRPQRRQRPGAID